MILRLAVSVYVYVYLDLSISHDKVFTEYGTQTLTPFYKIFIKYLKVSLMERMVQYHMTPK